MSNVNFKIVDIFESIKDDIFVNQPWLVLNENLKNFTSHKISVSVPIELSGYGVDGDAEMINMIKNEMNQNIYKKVLQELFNTSTFDYIDISKTVNTHQSVNDMIDFVDFDGGYKYLISSGGLSNSLADSSRFRFKQVDPSSPVQNFPGLPYMMGSLLRYDVYTDPFMKYDDYRICLFDTCYVNVSNINQSVISANTFAPRMVVSYDIDYQIGDSKVIFVLDGNDSTSYRKYKKLQRDIKIDSVLNEEEKKDTL